MEMKSPRLTEKKMWIAAIAVSAIIAGAFFLTAYKGRKARQKASAIAAAAEKSNV